MPGKSRRSSKKRPVQRHVQQIAGLIYGLPKPQKFENYSPKPLIIRSHKGHYFTYFWGSGRVKLGPKVGVWGYGVQE